MLRRLKRQQRYSLDQRHALSPDANRNIMQAIDRLLDEDRQQTRLVFDKASPVVDAIFSALANHDVRFEFDTLTLDDCHCEKISEYEYNLLCSLKQLPDDELRVEGKESNGAFTVRLSRNYKQSCDRVSWEDICLPADGSGCRYFSTTKLLEVLMASLKHAIQDALSSNTVANGALAKCRMKNDLIILDVKVAKERLSFNLLPAIQLSRETTKRFALNAKITKISKHLNVSIAESVYLVAKPILDYPEELWRITVNNIENTFLSKMKTASQCGSHCLFAVTLLNEQFSAAEQSYTALPYYFIRLALLAEFLKYPHENYWKERNFTERVESILLGLETSLYKGELKNVFTGVNILGHRQGENLSELSSQVGKLRSRFGEILLNLIK